MGIEIFWPHKFNPDTSGTADYSEASKYKADAGIVISGNVVYDCGSMGISLGGNRNGIVANNSISNVRWVGLELVGDATTSAGGVARPNANVNMTVIGNSIYNVNAQPRGLKKAYKPTHSTTSTSINTHFAATGSVDLSAVVTGTSVVTITLTSPYPALQVGKQLIARDTSALTTNTFTAKIVTYDQTTGQITALVSAKTGTATVSAWTVFIRRTVVLQLDSTTAMAWGTSAASATSGWTVNSLGVHVLNQDTNTLSIVIDSTASAADQLAGFLAAYNPTTQQATIELTSASGSNTSAISSWKAFNHNVLVAVSIDQINGVLFSQNTINTIVDTTRIRRTNGTLNNVAYGTQIYLSKNIHVFDNVWTRCGQFGVFVNNSSDVCVEGNKFVSPVVDGTVADGISVTRASSGANAGSLVYDPSNPVTELGEDKGENDGVAVYIIATEEIILRRNFIRNSTANDLVYLTNGTEIYSDKFVRPESGRFGNDVYLKTNDFRDITNNETAFPSPPVDYTLKWTNSTQEYTGYRFHVNPFQSLPESKAFAVSVGASKYIYNWYLGSTTSQLATLPLTPSTITMVISSALAISATLFNNYFAQSDAIAVGTFVRGVPTATHTSGSTEYFEGIVTGYNAGTKTATIAVHYSTITTAIAAWNLYCDQDAVYVSKTGDLVLRHDLRSDKTVGTKIGQTAAEKFAFWGATPVVQPATVAVATDAATAISQLNLVIGRLKTLGLIAT
jgi:parallel beta-helix repeat protein